MLLSTPRCKPNTAFLRGLLVSVVLPCQRPWSQVLLAAVALLRLTGRLVPTQVLPPAVLSRSGEIHRLRGLPGAARMAWALPLVNWPLLLRLRPVAQLAGAPVAVVNTKLLGLRVVQLSSALGTKSLPFQYSACRGMRRGACSQPKAFCRRRRPKRSARGLPTARAVQVLGVQAPLVRGLMCRLVRGAPSGSLSCTPSWRAS